MAAGSAACCFAGGSIAVRKEVGGVATATSFTPAGPGHSILCDGNRAGRRLLPRGRVVACSSDLLNDSARCVCRRCAAATSSSLAKNSTTSAVVAEHIRRRRTSAKAGQACDLSFSGALLQQRVNQGGAHGSRTRNVVSFTQQRQPVRGDLSDQGSCLKRKNRGEQFRQPLWLKKKGRGVLVLAAATEGDVNGGENLNGSAKQSGSDDEAEADGRNGTPDPISLDDETGRRLLEELAKERERADLLFKELEEAQKRMKDQEMRMEASKENTVEGEMVQQSEESGGIKPLTEAKKTGEKEPEPEAAPGSLLGSLTGGMNGVGSAVQVAMNGKKGIQRTSPKLDLTKIRECFSYTTFFATESRRYGSGGMFPGNLRAPVEIVAPALEKKISEATESEVTVWFMIDEATDREVCVVQPKDELERRLVLMRMAGIARWPLSILLSVTTVFTTAFISGVTVGPNASVDDVLSRALPLAFGLGCVLMIGEIWHRIVASRYGVKLSPPYPIPSGWLGCLGVATKIESLLPSKNALFDIAAARAVGCWVGSFILAVVAFTTDGGVNGGSHPLYVEPSFFQPNVLLSFIQYVIGPYYDELGNVLPHAVPGVGVPVNPLAFAGLLGLVITSLNLLPAGELEGGRIFQALFGRRRAGVATIVTTTLLGVGGLAGSVLCLAWGFILLFLRNGQELPALDEVTPVGRWRLVLGWILLGSCLLILLPNSAGSFPSTFFTPPAFLSKDIL